MSSIRTIDMMFLDDLFDMHGGYVLDFSNKTFAIFFADELNIDIDDDRYSSDGSSKGRRLRYFLRQSENDLAARTLEHLWQYREVLRQRTQTPESVPNAAARLIELVNRLKTGQRVEPTINPIPAFDNAKAEALKGSLIAVSELGAHERGFAFEKFLTQLFAAFNLRPHEPFRNVGEQIDGSFALGNDIYLLEAKWQSSPVDAAALHTFHGKIEQKADWARGLFVSHSGFSEPGLEAFGRGKRIICMDGLDLYDMLDRKLPLTSILEKKVRRAAETGKIHLRVRDLFPS